MVTAPEAAVLLGAACEYDNRRKNVDTVNAWAVALIHTDFQDALAAIHAHYAESTDWLTPSQVRAEVRRIEAVRVAEGPNLDELEPPEWLSNMDDGPEFVAAYSTWYKRQRWLLRRGMPLEVGPPPEISPNRYKQLA